MLEAHALKSRDQIGDEIAKADQAVQKSIRGKLKNRLKEKAA